jgi:putative aldouronate transport system substrate-binding protein
MEQLSIKTPSTWDDVYQMLKTMKAAHPNSLPFSDRFSKPNPAGNLLNMLSIANGLAGAGWNFQHTTWDAKQGKYVYTYATDGYKDVVTYLAKLVKEGLLDPETFTQTDDQARQKLATGKSFVISTNAQSIVNDYRPDFAKSLPNAKIAKIPFPVGSAGELNGASRLENGVMISAKARDEKNFVAMMQFIDWLWYSEKGEEFAKWGVEGTTFVKDSGGKDKLAPDVNVLGLNPSGTKHLQKDFGFYNGVFAYGGTPELVQGFFSEEEQAFQKIMNGRKAVPVGPPAPFSDEEREQVTLWENALKDFVGQMTLKFALGQRPLSEWDQYVSELKAKNMTQYMDIVTKAYDRYKKAHG